MKNHLLPLMVLTLISWPVNGATNDIPEKNIPLYVSQCIQYWFYPNHNHQSLPPLEKRIAQQALQSSPYSTFWNWSCMSYDRYYNTDVIEQHIRGAVLEHIRQGSYDYAYELSKQSSIARQVADHLYQELFNICAKSMYLQSGVFGDFIGNGLRARVQELVSWYTAAQIQPKPKLFPSPHCAICLEDFPGAPRVYLMPCGHDLCAYCADRWFLQEHKTSCPHCRGWVDRAQLQQAINGALGYTW